MTRRASKAAAKERVRKINGRRPFPRSIEPELPPHLKRITFTALAGTIGVPIGSSLEQIYLAAARALIAEALVLERARRDFVGGAE